MYFSNQSHNWVKAVQLLIICWVEITEEEVRNAWSKLDDENVATNAEQTDD